MSERDVQVFDRACAFFFALLLALGGATIFSVLTVEPPAYSAGVFLGMAGVSWLVLRPYVKPLLRIWGWPGMSPARLVSLLLLLPWVVLMFLIGYYNHPLLRVLLCVSGLTACVVYLWLRACWLLDQHGVH